MEDNKKGFIDPKELTTDTYIHYCRLYLTDRIWKLCPSTSVANYGHVNRLVNIIDYKLFKNLHLETNRVLLINYIYSTFLSCLEIELPREELYKFTEHLCSYDPEQRRRG